MSKAMRVYVHNPPSSHFSSHLNVGYPFVFLDSQRYFVNHTWLAKALRAHRIYIPAPYTSLKYQPFHWKIKKLNKMFSFFNV
ncbi:hypothetical protein BK142_32505 [Paenibacillus glucanolyticus]|nr:hypothetical protein BK142_32505 [Paenibacillus glucanolyticus]